MKNKKLILFSILVCSFLFICVLIPTLAKLVTSKTNINSEWDGSIASSFNSGSGTIESPYIISNASEFAYFKESLKTNDYKNKYIKITNDIILNKGLFKKEDNLKYIKDDVIYYLDSSSNKYYEESTFENNVGFINEFEMMNSFNGTLDGGSHTIYGLYIKGDNSSLFENISGSISNLIIENAYIYGEYSSSGLALNSNGSTINNVVVDGNILSSGNKTQNVITNNVDDIIIDEETNLDIDVDLPSTSAYTFTLSGTCAGDTTFTINGSTVPCEDFKVNVNPFNLSISSNSRVYLTNLKYEYFYDVSISAGLILKASDTNIENAVNRAYIENKLASGLVGTIKNTSISKSYNLGSINGDNTSGLVDTIISSTSSLSYTYNEGNLTNISNGLVSNIIDSTVSINNSYNAYNTSALGNKENSSVSISNSYNKISDANFLSFNKNVIKEMFNNEDFIYDDIPLIKLDYDDQKYVNIILKNNTWNTFKDSIDYISYDEDLSFILSSAKDYKAIKDVYYYLSEDELTKETLESVNWINYENPIGVTQKGTYILYVKVVNYNDETNYINTDRVYLYVDNIYAKIKVDNQIWDNIHEVNYSFLNNKSFEIKAYSKNDIKSIEYLTTNNNLDLSELENTTSWIKYQEPVNIMNDSIIYVKVEDNSSNIMYLNSDHFVDVKYNITNLKSGGNLEFNSNMTYNSSISFNVELDSVVSLEGFTRSIVSSEVLPTNTHIVINDLLENKIYEYFTTETTEKEIPLNNFKEVGVTSELAYSNKDTKKEKYNIIFDFGNIEETNQEYSIIFKANKMNDEVTSDAINFRLNSLDDINSNLSIRGYISSINYNSFGSTNITFNTSLNSKNLNTNLEDLNPVLIIEVLDKDKNIVNKENYKGIKFIYKSKNFSPNDSNKTLIKLDSINNVSETLTINTSEDINALLADGDTIKISLGLAYNNIIKNISNNSLNVPIYINGYKLKNYSFNVNTDKRILSTNELFKLKVSSSVENPTIKVSLYKKKERNGINQEYTEVKLSDYINESIESISKSETLISFKDDVEKNSYMFKFELYDGDTFIGDNSIKVVVR